METKGKVVDSWSGLDKKTVQACIEAAKFACLGDAIGGAAESSIGKIVARLEWLLDPRLSPGEYVDKAGNVRDGADRIVVRALAPPEKAVRPLEAGERRDVDGNVRDAAGNVVTAATLAHREEVEEKEQKAAHRR